MLFWSLTPGSKAVIRESRNKWIRAAMKIVGAEPSQPIPHATSAFELRGRFLASGEAGLYSHLCEALGERAVVCPKVRALDVLRVPNAPKRIDEAVRLDRKYLDFLICDRGTWRPVCAIQLDRVDESSKLAPVRDEFLEKALITAGLSVLHIRTDRVPSIQMVRERIYPLLDGKIRRVDSGQATPPAKST
jgi:Protein of unknown function (DUF2726)